VATKTPTRTPVLDALQALEAKLDDARARVAQREADVRQKRAELEQLRAMDGGGAAGDEEAEALELGGTIGVRRAVAALEGARMAVTDADDELRAHIADNLDLIEAELRQDEPAEVEALFEAVDRLGEALAPLTSRWRQVARLYSRAGRATQIPGEPFERLRRELDRVRRERQGIPTGDDDTQEYVE
jgi:hypothetical protein